jgi:virulence factor Mce-like protein
MNRWVRRTLLAVLAVCLVAGTAFVVRQTFFAPMTITANFASATGLYPGDEVRIAGVKVGNIRAIAAKPDRAEVILEVDHGVHVPADAKAVIVAQNLIAARYVQLAPLYTRGESQMTDGATIPVERTAVPVEWDEVKTQLTRLATELGPRSDLSDTSISRFIDSAAEAMAGNGAKLRQTFAQLSALARILSDGSGDIVATIKNLQTFVTALRDSSDELVAFGDRLATFSTVLADSRTDLEAAMKELAVAVSEVQRFIAGTRDKTSEQVQRLANVTQVLHDQHLDLENILHIAPTAFANAYSILNPNYPGAVGSFILNNISDPLSFICAAISGVANVTAAESGKLCAQYLGPALNSVSLNYLPIPQNFFLQSSVTPDKIIYTDPALAPGGAGSMDPPEPPPAVSAYTGAGDVPPPLGFLPPPPAEPAPRAGPLPAETPLPAEGAAPS